MYGRLRRMPKLAPLASRNVLFGPGVTDVTKLKTATDIKSCNVTRLVKHRIARLVGEQSRLAA
jgi:hypothetical protein